MNLRTDDRVRVRRGVPLYAGRAGTVTNVLTHDAVRRGVYVRFDRAGSGQPGNDWFDARELERAGDEATVTTTKRYRNPPAGHDGHPRSFPDSEAGVTLLVERLAGALRARAGAGLPIAAARVLAYEAYREVLAPLVASSHRERERAQHATSRARAGHDELALRLTLSETAFDHAVTELLTLHQPLTLTTVPGGRACTQCSNFSRGHVVTYPCASASLALRLRAEEAAP